MDRIVKNNICALCQKSPSELHHILGRKGLLLNDRFFLIELCNDHHNKHSRAEVLKMIFQYQISRYGSHWLNKLIDKVHDMQIHKPKELNLAYSMKLSGSYDNVVNLSEGYEEGDE